MQYDVTKSDYYLYDESGVCGMISNGVPYYFRKNITGDVVAIYTATGSLICRYVYNAWGEQRIYDGNGNTLEDDGVGVWSINPFRYRGYYWDREFGLYYLQSRYYDPAVGRFISPDDIEYLDPTTVGGLNLYAYCGNNPVMYSDPSGHEWWDWLLGGVLIVASFALSIATSGLAAPIAAGLGNGLLGSILGGTVAGAVGGAITGFGVNVATQGILSGFESIKWEQVGWGTLEGTISGAIAGGVFGAIKHAASANKIASRLSGVSVAGDNYNKALQALNDVPTTITGSVVSTDKMAAQLAFNVASYEFYRAQSVYDITFRVVKYLYSLAQTGLKQAIGYLL